LTMNLAQKSSERVESAAKAAALLSIPHDAGRAPERASSKLALFRNKIRNYLRKKPSYLGQRTELPTLMKWKFMPEY